MDAEDEARQDYAALRVKLELTIDRLADPEERASGSDAASLARARRKLGESASSDRTADLLADYESLGDALALSVGSGAAAVAQERRMLRRLLASLTAPREESKVEQLDSWRASRAVASGAAKGRRQSR